jgi:hypothetical protein
MATYMRVDLALFHDDDLVSRDEIRIGPAPVSEMLSLYQADHWLGEDAADIVLYDFPEHTGLKRMTLDMPIHESMDWESLNIGRYTLAFWCRLDA